MLHIDSQRSRWWLLCFRNAIVEGFVNLLKNTDYSSLFLARAQRVDTVSRAISNDKVEILDLQRLTDSVVGSTVSINEEAR